MARNSDFSTLQEIVLCLFPNYFEVAFAEKNVICFHTYYENIRLIQSANVLVVRIFSHFFVVRENISAEISDDQNFSYLAKVVTSSVCKAYKKTSNLPGRPREAPHLWWLIFSPQIYSNPPVAQAGGKKSSLERNRRLLDARQLQTRAQGCRLRKKVI